MSKKHVTEMDPEGSCKKDNSKPVYSIQEASQ